MQDELELHSRFNFIYTSQIDHLNRYFHCQLCIIMLRRWGQMLFVCFGFLQNFAFKLITFIFTVNFAITAGLKADTASVVAGVLVKTARAEAHPLDFSPSREAAEVISDLPVVVAKHKAGEL